MPGFIGRVFSAERIGWVIAVGLVVVLALAATGTLDLRAMRLSGRSYADEAARLTGADRSEPLRMRLEGQYPGPLQDTIIQRWRDPVDGTVCYIYLPVAVAHAAGPEGLVQYGAANIGTISCMRRTD